MTVTSTWLDGGAVLAQLHIPDGATASAGVVLCPPLGQEHVIAYQTLRLLSDRLEQSGIASIRFDYPGQGDSTVLASEGALLDGIRVAASALRNAGCTRIVYLGLTVGALLAQEAARADPETAGLVLWDPSSSGHHWIRRLRSLYATSVADATSAADADGTVNVVGAEFDPDTVDMIQSLVYDPPTGRFPVLAAVRRGQEDHLPGARRLGGTAASRSRSEGSRGAMSLEQIVVDGHVQLLDGDSVVARIPASSVENVAAWIVGRFGPDAGSKAVLHAPAAQRRAEIVTSGPDGPIELVEEIVRLGPDRLFAIETRPADAADDTPAIVLHTGSTEHRVGPARFQVLQARRLAASGIRAVRVDRRGTGESSEVSPDGPNYLYTREWLDDNANIIRALGLPSERVGVAGQCVGAWLALATDPSLARSVIAIGVGTYRTGTSLPNVIRDATARNAALPPSAEVPPRRSVALLKRVLPYWAMMVLARLRKAELVEVLLTPPMREGSKIVLLMSPQDQEVFFEKFGERAVERFSDSPGELTTVLYDKGDHALFHAGLRRDVLDDVDAQARRIFARFLAPHSEREQTAIR